MLPNLSIKVAVGTKFKVVKYKLGKLVCVAITRMWSITKNVRKYVVI